MRESDVYKWYFKNDLEYRQKSPSTAYWCLDNLAVVHNGNLIDTYWLCMDKERISESSRCHRLDVDKVDIEFVCNLNDVRFIEKWQIDDYDKVYDLSHQKHCYSLYAVDKDAEVSNEALKKKYLNEYKELLSKKEFIELRLAWLDGKLSKLEELK